MSINLEYQTVAQVQDRIPDSHRVLRNYRIDASDRMLLSTAAAAASVTTDELLAVLEDRMRRAARKAQAAQRGNGQRAEEHELELAY